jgi:phage terminase small subunit
MPARKPRGLNKRHATAAEKLARVEAEQALTPKRTLPINPPAALSNRQVAAAVWRRLMRIYAELEADIITTLDQDLLMRYCILIEQLGDLDELRREALKTWQTISTKLEKEGKKLDAKAYTRMVDSVNASFEQIVKIDGRSDRKSALILQMSQSLYLTPRSRAGVAPQAKAAEEPESELDKLLNEFTGAAEKGMKK